MTLHFQGVSVQSRLRHHCLQGNQNVENEKVINIKNIFSKETHVGWDFSERGGGGSTFNRLPLYCDPLISRAMLLELPYIHPNNLSYH